MLRKALLSLTAAAVGLTFSSAVLADTLFMKNGDKIAGDITQVEIENDYSLVPVNAEGISKLIFSDSYEEGRNVLIMKNGDKISGIINQVEIQTDYGLIKFSGKGIEMISFSVEPPLILGWKFSTGAPISSSPLLKQDKLYAGSWDHFLYALEAKTGQLKWKFKTDGYLDAAPLITGNTVYVCSSEGRIYAIERDTGKEKWTHALEERIKCTPVEGQGFLYLTSYDGFIYALESITSAKLRKGEVPSLPENHP